MILTVHGVSVKLRRNGSKPENPRKRCHRGGLIAWFMHDEGKRSLEAGKLADLAVLSKAYMLVPVDRVGGIESVVTMVGGKVMFAANGFQNLKQ